MISVVLLFIVFKIINSLLKDDDKKEQYYRVCKASDNRLVKERLLGCTIKEFENRKYISGNILIVREEWNKNQVKEQPKISSEASLIYSPQKWFYSGTKIEQCKTAMRYFNERVSYIYTRRCMFNHLSHIEFHLSLEFATVDNGQIIEREKVAYINSDSSVPPDFSHGLYRKLNKPYEVTWN